MYHISGKTSLQHQPSIRTDGGGQNGNQYIQFDLERSSESETKSQLVVCVLNETASDGPFEHLVPPNDLVPLLDPDKPRYFWANFLEGFHTRMDIIRGRGLWVHMCAIAGVYISSLFLFPGFVTSVKPLGKNLDYLQRNGIDPSWVPVILVTTYNSCNLCGKVLSSFIDPKRTSPSLLLQGSLARFMIVPVFLFCVYPQDSPYFYDVRIPFALTVMLGISNGYFGSASMIIAPQVVTAPSDRELVGNMTTLSIHVGLAIGSVGAYAFQFIIS